MNRRKSDGARTRLGTMFQRAGRGAKVSVVVLGLVAAHGLYVLFVPGVDVGADELECPPAVVAAVSGSAGLPAPADAEEAAAHDAACTTQGRWWVLAAGAQTLIALVWAAAILEWGRARRRARRAARRRRRRERRAARADAAVETG